MANAQQNSRTWVYIIFFGALFIGAFLGAIYLEEYMFNPITTTLLVKILLPIFAISVFVERAQEVFVSAWREIERAPLDQNVKNLEAKVAQSPEDKALVDSLNTANMNFSKFKAKTRRIAFLFSLAIGVMISTVGVRVLRSLTSMDADPVGIQRTLFDLADIILTGALIGGGSEGVHRVMAVITDFLDGARDRVKPKPQAAGKS